MENYINNNGVKIHYEVMGKGPITLLLLAGFGGDMSMWRINSETLSKHFKIILMDNRGVGLSDKPDGAYSMKMFSSDIKCLLDELNITSTYILGVSMGGLISIQFYKDFPEYVKGIILVSTIAGIPKKFQAISQKIIKNSLYNFITSLVVPGIANTINSIVEKQKSKIGAMAENLNIQTPDMNIINFLTGRKGLSNLSKEEYLNLIYSYVINKNNDKIKNYFTNLIENKKITEIKKDNQLQAVLACSHHDFLKEIKVPSLIIHGGKDKILNVKEAILLNKNINNSDLIIYGDCGHYLFLENEDIFNNDVIRYINRWEKN